ncbi:MAG: MSCRAMM family adhesin SdrC [Chitinophagales bacterium]|nr:MSCRAMM family adhesin SdrC [Chitinophagales bacterium]
MKLRLYSTLFLGILLFSHCKKEEGYGGLASIEGRVYAVDYNKDGEFVDEGYVGDREVYIGSLSVKKNTNGDEVETSKVIDRIRTSYDGFYIFEGLRKGTYDVWVYSLCSKCVDDVTPIVRRVEVKGKKSRIVLEDFKIDL